MRTVATTPAWSEGQNGGDAWNGVSPIRCALTALAAACVSTRSIRDVNCDVGFVSGEFWQQDRPGSPGLVFHASLKYECVRLAYVVVVLPSAAELKSPVAITAPPALAGPLRNSCPCACCTVGNPSTSRC